MTPEESETETFWIVHPLGVLPAELNGDRRFGPWTELDARGRHLLRQARGPKPESKPLIMPSSDAIFPMAEIVDGA